jgi:hypothetical protein
MGACNSGNILSCLGCNLGSLIVGNIVPLGRHDSQQNGIQQNDTQIKIMLSVAFFSYNPQCCNTDCCGDILGSR